MGTGNANARAMGIMARELRRAGIGDVVVSPGSRSTAPALALVQAGLRPWVVTDERAAAFFALGMARASTRPVALLCTSGTAAANYLPAIVEASASEIPLVVLTADRPPELRACHAAQTIDQVGLYGTHVRWSVDAPTPSPDVDLGAYFRTLAARAVAAALEAPRGPVHLNLPMREPLVDVADERRRCTASSPADGAATAGEHGPAALRVHGASGLPAPFAVTQLAALLAARPRGLVVCGPTAAPDPETAAAIARLADRLGWPVLADPLSGLRFGRHDRASVVDAYDLLLQGGPADAGWHPDAVLQIGTPTVSARLQRLLAAARPGLHVVVAPPGRWPDPLFVATDVVRADPRALCETLVTALPRRTHDEAWLDAWRVPATAARAALDRLLAEEPTLFEGTVLAELAPRLADGVTVQVGNSLPVRALDTFVGGATTAVGVACNRGANGIDGVLATALGGAATGTPTVLVVGDLSFLHDLGALQIAARHAIPLLAIVINNDGGGIFSFLPQAELGDTFEPLFVTPHGLELGGAVAMCGGRYARVGRRSELGAAIDAWRAHPAFTVVEVPTSRTASRALHERLVDEARRATAGAARRAGAR